MYIKDARKRIEKIAHRTKRDKRANVEAVTWKSYAHDGGSITKMAATEAVAFTSRVATTTSNQTFLKVEVQIAQMVFLSLRNKSVAVSKILQRCIRRFTDRNFSWNERPRPSCGRPSCIISWAQCIMVASDATLATDAHFTNFYWCHQVFSAYLDIYEHL
jgi:hypothetical protein